MTEAGPRGGITVLFDGACGFCRGSAAFLSRRDRQRRFRLLDGSSPEGRDLLSVQDLDPERLDTLVAIEEGQRAFTRSDAALRIARGLGWPWRAACILAVVPRPVRDLLYDAVARNRYCLVPSAAKRVQTRR